MILEFVIDTTGYVDPATLTVVITSGEAFSYEAVRVLLETTYSPGRLCGKPVRVLAHQPVTFRLGR